MWGRLQQDHHSVCGYRFTRRTCGDDQGAPARLANKRFTPTHVGTTQPYSCLTVDHPVHPHACGDDYIMRSPACASTSVPPPRMWGRRLRPPSLSGFGRFTPTHVGTTHFIATIKYRSPGGSPPRMWGRRHPTRSAAPDRRFTPTHVGTTTPTLCSSQGWPVHPHACGDDLPVMHTAASITGSPPRMWGRRQRAGRERRRYQSTHACGDDLVQERPTAPWHFGSPPRMWGRRHLPGHRNRELRFAPRMWGRLGSLDLGDGVSRFTPRMWGLTRSLVTPPLRFPVPPPRMWGRRSCRVPRLVAWRFTPTHVGTTDASAAAAAMLPVHPHACGDDFGMTSVLVRGVGSPPRMWGRRGGVEVEAPGSPPRCGDDGDEMLVHRRIGGSPPHAAAGDD